MTPAPPPDLNADDIFGARDPMAEDTKPTGPTLIHVQDAIRSVRVAMDAGPPRVVGTPYGDLNYLFDGGFRAGELVFLGARPGVGKTALALEIARHAARNTPVLVVSREMVVMALVRRLVAQDGKISASELRRNVVCVADMSRIAESFERLSGLDLWLTDEAVSLKDISQLVATPPPPSPAWGLVIVDYLQLVRSPDSVKDRRLQVEAVSQGLKGLALEHKLPVLCLTSLRRPQINGTRPTMADLRESGELEHDADIIILLHREPDEPGKPPNTIVECDVAKNRDGETGRRDLIFSPRYVSFSAREYEAREPHR